MHEKMCSAYSMLERANELAVDFRKRVNEYLLDGSYEKVDYFDEATGESITAVRLVKKPPAVFDNIASDIIVNLRSALDQSAYAVSIAAGGQGKNTYFPIAKTFQDVVNMKRGGSNEVPQEVFDVMVDSKPYKDGDYYLWAMAQLCNANKHKLLCATGAVAGNSMLVSMHVEKSEPDETVKMPLPVWDNELNQLVVCRYRGRPPKANIEVLRLVAFDFDELTRVPADGVLLRLVKTVGEILGAVQDSALKHGYFKI